MTPPIIKSLRVDPPLLCFRLRRASASTAFLRDRPTRHEVEGEG